MANELMKLGEKVTRASITLNPPPVSSRIGVYIDIVVVTKKWTPNETDPVRSPDRLSCPGLCHHSLRRCSGLWGDSRDLWGFCGDAAWTVCRGPQPHAVEQSGPRLRPEQANLQLRTYAVPYAVSDSVSRLLCGDRSLTTRRLRRTHPAHLLGDFEVIRLPFRGRRCQQETADLWKHFLIFPTAASPHTT